MADFLTHILLSDDVMDRIESRRIFEGIARFRPLYRLGAQGPDPLFFYNFLRRGKGVLGGLGGRMHNSSTGAFLRFGFERLRNVSWDDSWLELAAYLAGFICHFTLDRMIHPYVYWATDSWIWSVDGIPVKTTHLQVEMSLDIILWREKRGTPACKVKTRKFIDIGGSWPKSTADFLIEAFRSIYGVQAYKEDINKALADFYRGHDFLYDPRGWKKRLIQWLDSFTGGGLKPPRAPYPEEEDKMVDWANKKRRTWKNPFTGEEHRDSVEDILNRASLEAANQINEIFSRILRHEPIEDLFSDISYITGQPCTES
jgi:hypothetical protein